jgi:hypothetical protein
MISRSQKTRREFLKDGLRTVIFGGFIFTSTFLGLRKFMDKDSTSTCPVNLPCDNCSKLKNCQEPKAIHLKQKQGELTPESLSIQKGITNAK